MSLVLSFRTPIGVAILTDGAVYDLDHRLTGVRRKVEVSDKVPVAVATRGHVGMGDVIAKWVLAVMVRFGFDDGLAHVGENLQWLVDAAEGHFQSEVVIGGYSEKTGPCHRVFQTFENRGEPAGVLLDPGNTFLGVNVDGGTISIEEIAGRKPSPDESVGDYFYATGARMVEFFRRKGQVAMPGSLTDTWEGTIYCVGGQVDLTLIGAQGALVETIHQWPDRIGHMIDPFAGNNVVPIAAMNRHQRRAAAKAA